MALFPASNSLEIQDPQRQVRHLVARYLFGTAATVSLVSAAVFSLLPAPIDGSSRAIVALMYLLVGVIAAAATRASASGLTPAMVIVALSAEAAVGATAPLLGWGLNSPSLGFCAVIACAVAAVSGWRAGAVTVAGGALALVLLAIAEPAGWLAGGGQPLQLPLPTRLAAHGFVLAAGLAAGVLLSRLLARYIERSRERERRFLGLLWIAAHAYWELGPDLRTIAAWHREQDSREFIPVQEGLGVFPWQVPGMHYDPADLPAHQADLAARRPFRDLHVRWQHPDGQLRHLLASGEPRFDAKGQFAGYWGVTRDATKDVQAHESLAAAQERYRELFERNPTPLVLQRRGQVFDANAAAASLFGYPDVDSMRGSALQSLHSAPEDIEAFERRLDHMDQLPPGAVLPALDFSMASLAGREIRVRVTGVRVQLDCGSATLSMYQDETERTAAEQALRRSQALLSHVVETSPDAIALTDLQTQHFAMVNQTFCRMLGYGAEEVIGRSSVELQLWASEDDRERLARALHEHGEARNERLTLLTRAGVPVPLLVSGARFRMDERDYAVMIARDVSEIERTRRENEAILQNASIGIAFSRERRFVQANAAAEQMLGWRPGALVGESFELMWQDPRDCEAFWHQIAPALLRGEQVDAEHPLCRRDGSRFMARIRAKAVDPTRPRAGGTIWILDDITERRLMDQQLARARDEAEAASRAKSAFLANTSHELRTPLNGLVGLARLARQPGVAEAERMRYLEQMADSAETLSAIIDDILDVSKIEAGKLELESVAFDLHALVHTVQRAYGTLAEARGLDFRAELGGTVPRHVMGDPVRVRQILSNYLGNALKFTAQGGVRLSVQVAAPGRLRFEVNDTGPGIAPSVQSRLFEPFMQADQSTTRRFGGTGLGLSICRELASLMGGEVGMRSEPGAGSCFWAELPLPATDAPPLPAEDADDPSQAAALAGVRVLMVEDNPVNMMIAVALLEQWGMRVTQAHNGRQAVDTVEQAAARGEPFGVVLMDVQMPEMSGHQAARLLRQRHDARTLPIVALTAAALVSERESALAAGMNGFLTKPIDAQRLRSTLLAVLRDGGAAQR